MTEKDDLNSAEIVSAALKAQGANPGDLIDDKALLAYCRKYGLLNKLLVENHLGVKITPRKTYLPVTN